MNSPRALQGNGRLQFHVRFAFLPANGSGRTRWGGSNLGPHWTFSWLGYIEEHPLVVAPLGNIYPEYAMVYLRGGGEERYVGPPDGDGRYGVYWRQRATLTRVSSSPVGYERRLADGGVEVYDLADGAPEGQRRIFLTRVIDPQGNALHFTYDAQLRLVAVTDAVGQVTTLAYEWAPDPLKVTRVTDPFGRAAVLTYTADGQLASITDVVGLTSLFTYRPDDFVVALTTPYGTTTFRKETTAESEQWDYTIEATDPLGETEHLEYRWANAALAASEAANTVPTGFAAANANLDRYNTMYWDKRAWKQHRADPAYAIVTHWLLYLIPASDGTVRSEPVAHSVKRPLENRVWYAYPGQPGAESVGTHSTPSGTAPVLDDGTTQVWQTTYNEQGQVTSRTDPLGRQTSYTYAANGIDLLEVRQTSPGVNDLLASYSNYSAVHQPGTVTDAAGQTTSYTYNAAGQVETVTTPARAGISENRTTTYTYDTEGRLDTVTRPAEGATTTYTYDNFGRVRTVTDEDGYTITTDYDALNRPTRVTYPDGSYEATTYQRLDPAIRRDRLGRLTRYTYDALGRLMATRDPAGRVIGQTWCACGRGLESLTDANGHTTRWERDAQGRVTREVRADGTTATVYTYEATTSRLKTVRDPKQPAFAKATAGPPQLAPSRSRERRADR